jgi:hypothetical protein
MEDYQGQNMCDQVKLGASEQADGLAILVYRINAGFSERREGISAFSLQPST